MAFPRTLMHEVSMQTRAVLAEMSYELLRDGTINRSSDVFACCFPNVSMFGFVGGPNDEQFDTNMAQFSVMLTQFSIVVWFG